MAAADSAQQADQGSETPSLEPRAELLNVLIRGLEMARRKTEPGIPGEEPLELFCTFSYAEAGTLFCPLFYYHA
jgi:hypothetical protein